MVCDQDGRLVALHLTAGQVSDYKGAQALLDELPKARALLADRGYDAAWFRESLKDHGIKPWIPSKKNRKQPASYDKALYKQRHKIEYMFAKLKEW